MEIFNTFHDPNSSYYKVLDRALKISGYDTVADGTMSIIISLFTDIDLATTNAIRAMANYIKSMDTPTAGTILQSIATLNWQDVGIDQTVTPTLDSNARSAIISAVMASSKAIILAEAQKLEILSEINTDLPLDWDSEPEPTEED